MLAYMYCEKLESRLKKADGDSLLNSVDEEMDCLASASALLDPVSWNSVYFGFNFSTDSMVLYDP